MVAAFVHDSPNPRAKRALVYRGKRVSANALFRFAFASEKISGLSPEGLGGVE